MQEMHITKRMSDSAISYHSVKVKISDHRSSPTQHSNIIGVTFVEAPVATMEEIEADLSARAATADIGMDIIFMMSTLLTMSHLGFGIINEFVTEHKLAIGDSTSYSMDTGAIFSHAPVSFEVGKLVAPLPDKILVRYS